MRACSSAEGREVLSGVKPSYSCLKERSRDYCPQDRDLWGKRHHTHKKSNVPIYVIWEGIFPVHHISKLIILNQTRHFCPFLNPVWRVRRGSCGFSKQRKLFMSSPGGFVIHLSGGGPLSWASCPQILCTDGGETFLFLGQRTIFATFIFRLLL